MDIEVREYIKLLFEGYKLRKKENRLYESDDKIPKIIIESYLELIEKPSFTDLITDYKNKYIFCESRVEPNISREEQMGLADVYDYIQDFDFDKDKFNVFVTTLILHNKLYKYCGDGKFGGKIRESSAILKDLNVEISSPEEAKRIFNSYIPKNDFILEKYNKGDFFGYIEDCIKLNVDLIKLQPFADGNKRVFRAMLNLLLKKLNIPPVYIEIEERFEYKKALIKAIIDEDYEDLIQFYYYKICDSIATLDIINSKISEESAVGFQKI